MLGLFMVMVAGDRGGSVVGGHIVIEDHVIEECALCPIPPETSCSNVLLLAQISSIVQYT